jgi:hypothetical protein
MSNLTGQETCTHWMTPGAKATDCGVPAERFDDSKASTASGHWIKVAQVEARVTCRRCRRAFAHLGMSAARKAVRDAFSYLSRGCRPGGAFDTDAIEGDGPLTPSFAIGAARGAIARASQLLGDDSLSDALDREYGWGKYRLPESAAPASTK